MVAFDTVNYSVPNHVVTMQAWGAGRLPLWNDQIFGGVSHLGNTQTGALYPIRLLTWGLEPTRALNLLAAGHLVLLAVGMLLVARRLSLGPPFGFLVATIGIANGAVLTRALQFEQICVLAWAPWLLVGIHSCLRSNRPLRAIAGSSAVGAMALLAGHPQTTYMIGALAAAWALALLLDSGDWRRWWTLLGAGMLTLLTAALQLVATLAAARESAISGGRSLADLVGRDDLSLRPERLVQAIGGTMRDLDPAVVAGGFESVGYVGAGAAVLAVCGASGLITSPTRRAFGVVTAGATILFVIFSLGPRTPIFRIAFRILPGFDLARASARWLTVASLLVAILAGFGCQMIWARAERRPMLWVVAICVPAIGLLAATGTVEVTGRQTVGGWIIVGLASAVGLLARTPAHQRASRVAAIAAVLVELLVASTNSLITSTTTAEPASGVETSSHEYLRANPGWAIAFTDDTSQPHAAIAGLRPNAHVLAGVRSIDGYDGGVQVTRRWLDLIASARPPANFDLPLRNQVPLPLDPDVAASLGIRFVLIANERDVSQLVPDWVPPVARDEKFSVYENRAWSGAAFIGDRDFALSRSSPTSMSVEKTGAGGLLEIDAQLHGGWRVAIDGEPAELHLTGFRLAVEVPGGDHVVTFLYRPRWLLPATLMSVLGGVMLLLIVVLESRQVRRTCTKAPTGQRL